MKIWKRTLGMNCRKICKQINVKNNDPHRGPGRLKIIRTGKPGRPRKVYQSNETQHSDPRSISQILERDDKES